MVGDESAALAHRLRTAGGCIHRSLEFELGVYLGAEENNVEGDIQP